MKDGTEPNDEKKSYVNDIMTSEIPKYELKRSSDKLVAYFYGVDNTKQLAEYDPIF